MKTTITFEAVDAAEVPEDVRAELALEAAVSEAHAVVPADVTVIPDDVLAEQDLQQRKLLETPSDDASRSAAIEEEQARYRES